jgi:hypothetical protein
VVNFCSRMRGEMSFTRGPSKRKKGDAVSKHTVLKTPTTVELLLLKRHHYDFTLTYR